MNKYNATRVDDRRNRQYGYNVTIYPLEEEIGAKDAKESETAAIRARKDFNAQYGARRNAPFPNVSATLDGTFRAVLTVSLRYAKPSLIPLGPDLPAVETMRNNAIAALREGLASWRDEKAKYDEGRNIKTLYGQVGPELRLAAQYAIGYAAKMDKLNAEFREALKFEVTELKRVEFINEAGKGGYTRAEADAAWEKLVEWTKDARAELGGMFSEFGR